ncbi:hypothetical protein [Sphingomonas aquatilis]|uniref:hypothetical protein n=1 Tax=Sphingomonas aquatilis TaxID=93063 RepID=UPI0023F9515B|nr:hypothetical protein [Sphingomonas aquatilis]MCI4654899.1 hypothetical protein [Sphingomonas aquatilis]
MRFLAHKRDVQQRRSGKLGDLADFGQVNAIVKAARLTPPSPRFVTDDAARSALNDAFLVDVAQTLSIYGLHAGDLRRSAEASTAFVQAAAAHIRGGATVGQEALLADTVVIGHVSGTDEAEQLDDGASSSVSVVVDQVLRGKAKVGDTLKLRRTSGKLPDGRRLSASDEDPLANGAPVALLASRSRYEKELAPQGGSARCPSCVVEVVPVFLVNGQSLVPTGGYPTATTLDALTAATK